jgi:hypothetical protein
MADRLEFTRRARIFVDDPHGLVVEDAMNDDVAQARAELDQAQKLAALLPDNQVYQDQLYHAERKLAQVIETAQRLEQSQHGQRQRADERQDWSDWNRWCDQRINAAIEAYNKNVSKALADEREYVLTKVANVIEAFEANIDAMDKSLRRGLSDFDGKLAELQTLLRSLRTIPDPPASMSSLRSREIN